MPDPSISHWSTRDAEMGSIAARALGRTGGSGADSGTDGGTGTGTEFSNAEIPYEQPQRSQLRRRLTGASTAHRERGDPAPAATPHSPPAIDESEFGFEADPADTSFADPLASEAGGEVDYATGATPFDDDYDSAYSGDEYDEDGVSQFEYRPPFTARRNPVKMWTLAALIFAVMTSGTIFAVNYYGLPDWIPLSRPTYGIGKPDLVLNFPEADQGREELTSGEVIFRVRGTIDNVGQETVSVPNLIVVFTDANGAEVFSKIVTPAKGELAPGESLKVTEAISGYPPEARKGGIGWSPR